VKISPQASLAGVAVAFAAGMIASLIADRRDPEGAQRRREEARERADEQRRQAEEQEPAGASV
jgi:hypothetical protein